jgi:alkylation response protein AidB-like acyl-CoA dehydrogenase
MLIDVQGLRSAVACTAWAVPSETPDRSLAASTAKVSCSQASRRVMDSALQVLGGVGFTWEHALHLYLKLAHIDQVVFGDTRYHLRRIAGQLRLRTAASAGIWQSP